MRIPLKKEVLRSERITKKKEKKKTLKIRFSWPSKSVLIFGPFDKTQKNK